VIVLDTHAWLWWMDSPRKLSRRARAAIETADRVGVSAISCYELGRLVARGRLRLAREVDVWVSQALADSKVQSLPITAEIALDAALFDKPLPGDPADRLIYATARAHGARLVTRDQQLRRFDRASTLW
jgi:PIN domain nuclease of toxin-antitoxin system